MLVTPLILSLVVSTAAPPSVRMPIYVRSAADTDGFTDPSKARQDSLKDLLKQLRDSDTLAPVDTEADAVAVLEVVNRATRRETNGWSLIDGQRQNKSVLTVRLTVGTYTTEFTGESKSKGAFTGYGHAAHQVIQQLEAWVTANRAKLGPVTTAPIR
jgi:hypothetical protein